MSLHTRVLVFLAGASLNAAAMAADLVPLRFVNGLPFVTVAIGAASSQMMFDSGGALGISLPESTVRQAGSVTLLERTTKFGDLHGKVYEVKKLVADRVVVGRTALAPVEGQVHVDWGGAPEGPDAELTRARQHGAIGLAAFGARPLMFDYGRGTLSIYAPSEAFGAGWQTLHLDYGKEGPNVRLVVNGKPLKFVLDTGAQVNLVDAGSLPGDPGEPGTFAELGEVSDSTGKPLGSLTAQRVQLKGAPFDGILGAPFFQRHRVLFDLAGQRLLIAPMAP
jgi:hypothetical protein